MKDYWKECISEAFEDAGITATEDQIQTVTAWVEGAHENYGMDHGHEHITSPLVYEDERLTKELVAERNKMVCKTCGGTGRIVTPGPYHSSNSPCYKCGGEGKL